ncbi:unnamed protein product [Gadus morhua 'NCC']
MGNSASATLQEVIQVELTQEEYSICRRISPGLDITGIMSQYKDHRAVREISSDGLPSQRVSYVEESTTHPAAWTERRDRQRWEHDCLRAQLRTGDVDGIIWEQLLPPDTLNNDKLWRGPDQHHVRLSRCLHWAVRDRTSRRGILGDEMTGFLLPVCDRGAPGPAAVLRGPCTCPSTSPAPRRVQSQALHGALDESGWDGALS